VDPVSSAPRFIYNGGYRNFHQELTANLNNCESFDMSVAFIRYSGLQLLLDTFKNLEDRNVPGRILTSTYLNSTEPKALDRLKRFSNIQTRVFVPSRDRGFHSKGYLFRQGETYTSIIGSANITQAALKSNVEWNVYNQTCKRDDFSSELRSEFDAQWTDGHTAILSDEFLREYSEYLARVETKRNNPDSFKFEQASRVLDKIYDGAVIRPNRMQTEAIVKLDRLRKQHESRALAIAATGSGKTYMAVFDSLQFRPRRLLFIVHREDILRKAKESFETIIGPRPVVTGLLTGNRKDRDADYIFATIQTLQNHYKDFPPETFDYIVLDEAHHASSPSYKATIDWFKPRFLLGLTATPERTDAGDIYSIFGNNVAIEIRLRQALDWELVAPFHYFGITDFEGLDYHKVDIDDVSAVARLLMVGRRVDYVIEKMQFYGHDGSKRKALGFCATVEHAHFMAAKFNQRSIPSATLTGDDAVETRLATMKRLEDDSDPLEIIFTVDIFNEGIDIPSINTVLMLRPTESAIIFVQQLGRGLRKTPDKEYVTVLDFIGNHRKSFLMALALMGDRHFDRDDLKVAVSTDFADIPGCSHIMMDRIAKDQILAQLEQEKFFSMKYLKQEYQDFKHMLGNRIPTLMDFLKVDGAVDPIKFSTYAGTWLEFVARMEQDEIIASLAQDKDLVNFLKFFTNIQPSKRIYDPVIAALALEKGRISKLHASAELAKKMTQPRDDIIDHTFRFLSGEFLDKSEKNIYKELLFNVDNGMLTPLPKLQVLYSNSDHKKQILDVLNYGILRYELEFGDADWGIPHLKLWEQYSMRDIALLSNSTRIHSSFRGQGLITDEKNMYIFVDLHKEVDIRESINYKDSFLSRYQFQWESPNTTSMDHGQGLRLVNHKSLGQVIHLFARKYKEVEGVTQPYIYFGPVLYQEHDPERNKPMRIYFALENEVPEKLYYEIVTKVD